MSMTPAQIITALQARHALISGIETATSTMPRSLDTVKLPCVLVFPGNATNEPKRTGAPPVTVRNYLARCYVQPLGQGKGDDGWQTAVTLLPLFYTAHENRKLGAGTMLTQALTDNGVVVAQFAGVEYTALEFNLNIME